MTPQQTHGLINASAGYNSPSFPVPGLFATHDQFVALGWLETPSVDPGQIAWLVQGYYTVGCDMVKGY